MYIDKDSKVIEKLKGLSSDNVIKKQVTKVESNEAYKDKFNALNTVVSAGREALEKGESYSKVKEDIVVAVNHVLGNEKQESDIKEEKPKEKMVSKPFQHKGDSIYVKMAHRPVA